MVHGPHSDFVNFGVRWSVNKSRLTTAILVIRDLNELNKEKTAEVGLLVQKVEDLEFGFARCKRSILDRDNRIIELEKKTALMKSWAIIGKTTVIIFTLATGVILYILVAQNSTR